MIENQGMDKKDRILSIGVILIILITIWYMLDFVLLTFLITFLFYHLFLLIKKHNRKTIIGDSMPDRAIIIFIYVLVTGILTIIIVNLFPKIAEQTTELFRLVKKFDMDVSYCFNRKEKKDHGEGGSMVGHKLTAGDRVLITEDVITAGTADRETIPILTENTDVRIAGLVVSVDRMEKGSGEKTAIQELEEDFGIKTFPIVSVKEVMDTLHYSPVDGKIYIDDAVRSSMEEYMSKDCVV